MRGVCLCCCSYSQTDALHRGSALLRRLRLPLLAYETLRAAARCQGLIDGTVSGDSVSAALHPGKAIRCHQIALQMVCGVSVMSYPHRAFSAASIITTGLP